MYPSYTLSQETQLTFFDKLCLYVHFVVAAILISFAEFAEPPISVIIMVIAGVLLAVDYWLMLIVGRIRKQFTLCRHPLSLRFHFVGWRCVCRSSQWGVAIFAWLIYMNDEVFREVGPLFPPICAILFSLFASLASLVTLAEVVFRIDIHSGN